MSTVRLVGFIIRAWIGGVWVAWLGWAAWTGHWSTAVLVAVCTAALAAWVLVDVIAHDRGILRPERAR